MTTSIISLIAQFDNGNSRPATADEIIAAAREHMSRRVRRGMQFSSPKATRDYLTLKLGSLEREVFAVIFLDKRHRLISYQEMFQGTIDGASVPHPAQSTLQVRASQSFHGLAFARGDCTLSALALASELTPARS